jgi:hypothetical protein
MNFIALFAALLCLADAAPAPPASTNVFPLGSADINRCQLFLFKQAGKRPDGFLRIAFDPQKSAELSSLIAADSSKQFTLVLNGKPYGEVDLPLKAGPSLDVKITSADDAFALEQTLVHAAPAPPPPIPAPSADAPVFSLMPDDVAKVVITLSKDQVELETTFIKPKQVEFAKTAAANLQKTGEIILNGKVLGQLTITKPTLGHSVKVWMASPSDAYAMARALIDPAPKTGPTP